LLDQLDGVEGLSNYPPYNIARTSENAYRISVAVTGFTDADLSIETKENRLTIHGEKQNNDEEKTGDVLYQGIAARSFKLADYVKAKGASLENGLLHVVHCCMTSKNFSLCPLASFNLSLRRLHFACRSQVRQQPSRYPLGAKWPYLSHFFAVRRFHFHDTVFNRIRSAERTAAKFN
jgi:HSP20 family molecular chaperone IbpA